MHVHADILSALHVLCSIPSVLSQRSKPTLKRAPLHNAFSSRGGKSVPWNLSSLPLYHLNDSREAESPHVGASSRQFGATNEPASSTLDTSLPGTLSQLAVGVLGLPSSRSSRLAGVSSTATSLTLGRICACCGCSASWSLWCWTVLRHPRSASNPRTK